MGIFKKAKKGINKAAKRTSSGLSTAANGIEAAANELERQGAQVHKELGKIEGYVEKGYDVASESVAKAVDEVGGFIEDIGAFLAKFGLKVYLKVIRPIVKDGEKMANGISELGPEVLGKILGITEDLLIGKYNSAVNTARALMQPGQPLYQFAMAYKKFPGTSLLISVDVAASAPANTSASGSIGLAIQLDPGKDIQLTVFAGMGASVSLDAPDDMASASISIGFAKGGPKSVAGPGISVGVGPFMFGFGCALAPPTFLPPFSSFAVSIPFEDFLILASTGTFKVDLDQASLGASAGMILQTVRRPTASGVHPLHRSELDGSQWISSECNHLVITHFRRNKKKNRDYFEVTQNGTLMPRDQHTLRKYDKYDKCDNNLLTFRDGKSDRVDARGRMSRDGNEFWLQGTGNKITWFRADE